MLLSPAAFFLLALEGALGSRDRMKVSVWNSEKVAKGTSVSGIGLCKTADGISLACLRQFPGGQADLDWYQAGQPHTSCI